MTTFGFWSGRKKKTFPDVLAAEKAVKRNSRRHNCRTTLWVWGASLHPEIVAEVLPDGCVCLTFAGCRYL